MAGNEQRPTDDVLGHGSKRPEEETAGGDRGGKRPDDVEGHRYSWNQDTEAVDEDQAGDDDVGGHVAKSK